MIDRKTFFDAVRRGPFTGLVQAQVQGMNVILDEWERRGLTDLRWLAYMLATAYHETAHTMQPIAEIGHGNGRKYGVPVPPYGHVYYGRGYVQLTWADNYEKMGRLIGVDLLREPDLAMRTDIAVKIMFEGMTRGTFTGKALAQYFDGKTDDPVNARRIINGTDKASLIAGYHRQFLAALQKASAVQPAKEKDMNPLDIVKTVREVAEVIVPVVAGKTGGQAVPPPMEPKGPMSSQTVMASVSAAVASIGVAYASYKSGNMEAFGAAVGAVVANIFAIVGRFKASAPIKLG